MKYLSIIQPQNPDIFNCNLRDIAIASVSNKGR